MKKTYVKPELETRTFAQFENVFAFCTKNTNNPKFGCVWVNDDSPGNIGTGEQSGHSRHVEPAGS